MVSQLLLCLQTEGIIFWGLVDVALSIRVGADFIKYLQMHPGVAIRLALLYNVNYDAPSANPASAVK